MFDIGTTEGQAILFGGIGAGLIAVVLLLLFVLHKQGRCCFSGASGSVRRHSTTRRRGPRGSELTRTNSTHSKAQQPQSSGYATSAGDLADFLENLVDGMERGRGAGGGGAGGGGGRDGASPRVIAGSGGGGAGKYNRADFSLITMQTQPNMNEPAIPTQEGGGAERTTSLLDDDMMLAGGGITHQKKAEITSWVASVLRQRTAEPLPHAAPVHHDDDDVVDISAMIPTSGSELGGPPSAPGNGALAATHIVSVCVDEASGGAEAKVRAMSHQSSPPGVALYCRDVTEDELSAQGPRATSTTDQQRREAAGEAEAAGRAGVESASAVGRASAADTPRVSQAASDTSR